jgi:hypothetical protein
MLDLKRREFIVLAGGGGLLLERLILTSLSRERSRPSTRRRGRFQLLP